MYASYLSPWNPTLLQIRAFHRFYVDQSPIKPIVFLAPRTRIHLQQTDINNNSVTNDMMLAQMNTVFLQYHVILLMEGSLDSRTRDAPYRSGVPTPGPYTGRCSSTTFKQAVGSMPWFKSSSFTFNVWTSEIKPVTSGTALNNVKRRRIGKLLNLIMHGWLELSSVSSLTERKSVLTFKKKKWLHKHSSILVLELGS